MRCVPDIVSSNIRHRCLRQNKISRTIILLYLLVGFFCVIHTSCSNELSKNLENSYDDNYGKKASIIADRVYSGKKVYMPIDIYFDALIYTFGENKEYGVIISCVLEEKLHNDLYLLNVSFHPLNIEFVIRKVTPIIHRHNFKDKKEFDDGWLGEMLKISNEEGQSFCDRRAAEDRTVCSIFIQFSLGYGISGLSKLPYWSDCMGIRICGPYISDYLLAHEFGHYFGLMHTFHQDINEGDFIDDTESGPENVLFVGTTLDPNCDNIMTYSDANEPRVFTKGQIEKMKRFMVAFRCEEIYEKIPEGCSGYECAAGMINDAILKLVLKKD